PDLIEMAKMSAGVRVEFTTDADCLDLPLEFTPEVPDQGAPNVLDVIVDGQLTRFPLADGRQMVHHDLPPGSHDVRLWLPQAGYTACGALTLTGATQTRPWQPRPRWITYGSSISQCHAAGGPSLTLPAITATALDWDLACLGFSGQCHLDPIAERAIAGLEADVITLCLGINSYNASAFSERTFAARVSGFIERVREAHPRVPILVVTPIGSPERERTPNAVGLTLAAMRDMIAGAVAVLQADGGAGLLAKSSDAGTAHTARAEPEGFTPQGSGDRDLYLIDGRNMIGIDEGHLLHDGLHPSAEGYRVMGERMAERLSPLDPGRPLRCALPPLPNRRSADLFRTAAAQPHRRTRVAPTDHQAEPVLPLSSPGGTSRAQNRRLRFAYARSTPAVARATTLLST